MPGLVDEAETALREWLRGFAPPKDRRLPSERSLATTLKRQHYAVNRAMARLVAAGLVRRDGHKLYLQASSPPPETEPKKTCELIVSLRSLHLPSFRKAARDLGIRLSLHTWESSEEMVAILRGLKPAEIQCVVLDPPFGIPSTVWDQEALRLIKQGVPVVSLMLQVPGVPCVMEDENGAINLLVDYLIKQGHREIAFLTVSPWNRSTEEMLVQWKSICAKYGLRKSGARIWLQKESRPMPEETRALARRFHEDWSEVTALVAFTGNNSAAQRLIDGFESHDIRIPQRISLCFVGDSKSAKICTPSITVAAVNMSLLHETAYQLAFHYLRKKAERGGLFDIDTVRIQERLIIRESTIPGPEYQKVASQQPDGLSHGIPSVVPLGTPDATIDFSGAWRKPYDLTAQAREERFASVDLASFVNRPLIFRRGWLGDLPLKNLDPGRQMIHGIPFEVRGGNKRSDCGAIVFRSMVNMTGREKKLPVAVDIPVGVKSEALYILHGCGYTKFFNRFATYRFFDGKKELGSIPIISLGRPQPAESRKELATAVRQSNIQDWWPDYPHYNFEHARMVPLTEHKGSEPTQHHVYLYTLEWINPHPKRTVTHMRIEVDAEQSTTLGILAISALKITP